MKMIELEWVGNLLPAQKVTVFTYWQCGLLMLSRQIMPEDANIIRCMYAKNTEEKSERYDMAITV